MYCIECGVQIVENSKFCSFCGKKQIEDKEKIRAVIINKEDSNQVPNASKSSIYNVTPKENSKIGIWGYIGILFGIFGILLMFYVAIPTPSTQTDQPTTTESANSTTTNNIPTTETFDYYGTATDEAGNSTQHTLKIKKDFSSAMIDSGPFTPIEALPNGMYQWVSSTIAGMKFNPQKETCTMFNLEGGYFCTLQRRN